MTSREIRRKFLEYFARYGHTIVPSSGLLPEKDPTLLFVNAGMVQFKNLFLGLETRPYKRATSCQKCVRAGGKHNDLDNIGNTLRHHTFFEMLGNFSFGDYFKADAIVFAWEFLTKELGLDESKMWISVFREDNEAEDLWKKIGVRPDRIVRLGEKDNFWSMGDEGPCGPCSEIMYDLGENVGCGRPGCAIGCDCDRFLEIWNLVFMEFDRSADGQMKKLPKPSIDTGMGLERITSIMQGKIGNYDTDLFVPLIRRIEDIAGCAYGENEKNDIAIRVIADHARGSTFIINDGVLPSKDGRGYVLRRIIRRALRYGRKLGIQKEFLHELSKNVVDVMEDAYPDIKNNHSYIMRVIKGEEERFVETLGMGMKLYEEFSGDLKKKGSTVIPGELVYKLYDTYGFPVDITTDMAEEDGLFIDKNGFEEELRKQKERSKTGSRIKGEEWNEGHLAILKQGLSSTFTGYETLKDEGIIQAILVGNDMIDTITEDEEGELFLNTTPFYAESGGQIDDSGSVTLLNGEASAHIIGVTKVKENLFAHRVVIEKGAFKRGDTVVLRVNEEKRKGVSRNHTATHLLQFALRKILGDHVKQSGSLVEEGRMRFDFTHFEAMKDEQIRSVEDIVNQKIMDCVPVAITVKSRENAIREGATALFEEKYGETVRVISIGDFSRELCGGTHVGNTGQIGSLYILSESSLASGVRRIEATTGMGAISYKRKVEGALKAIAKRTNTELDRVEERVESLLSEIAATEKELAHYKEDLVAAKVGGAIEEAKDKNGMKIVTMFVENATADDLRRVTDIVRSRVKDCIVIVGTIGEGDKGLIVASVSKDMQKKYSAGKIIKNLTSHYGGKGGGGPNIAQGGVPGNVVNDSLKKVVQFIDS
ncbi:MAG: alanine--tRNA ligase [Syntrophorhabdaceae bacterium]